MPFNDHMRAEGKRILRRGRDKVEFVTRMLPLKGATDELHRELRDGLRILRSAMDWLEDTPRFELAHMLLDDGGRLARERFAHGCQFPYENGSYHQRCPVALAHNRVGLSAAFTIVDSECSICKSHPEDCDHITGFTYDGQACYRIVKEIGEMLDVSIVGRPNIPDARIQSVSLSNSDFRLQLGKQFTPGMPISCDRCLNACSGIVRNFETSSH